MCVCVWHDVVTTRSLPAAVSGFYRFVLPPSASQRAATVPVVGNNDVLKEDKTEKAVESSAGIWSSTYIILMVHTLALLASAVLLT